MNDEPVGVSYRIEDLAHHSGATVRTIRAYQDRGLLPRPERRGRANVYADTHLARLRQIAGLLDRGYTLASIKELLDAWDTGRGLGGILGLVAGADGPFLEGAWADEQAPRISRSEPGERFGGRPDGGAVADAIEPGAPEPRVGEQGVPEPVPCRDGMRSVPLPEATMRAVEELVGAERAAEFVAIAAEREVRARTLDSLAAHHTRHANSGEIP